MKRYYGVKIEIKLLEKDAITTSAGDPGSSDNEMPGIPVSSLTSFSSSFE